MKRNRSRNKFLPRERVDRLLDPGASFLELSQVFISICETFIEILHNRAIKMEFFFPWHSSMTIMSTNHFSVCFNSE